MQNAYCLCSYQQDARPRQLRGHTELHARRKAPMVHGGTISPAESSRVTFPVALHFFLDKKERHLCYIYIWSLE